jgi:cytochrome P450
MEMPLLQSLYAETLRVYVTIMFLRTVQQETQLGGWTIPKGKKAMICSHSEHMNEKLWNPSPSVSSRHVTEFWAERFLPFSEPFKG